MFSNRTPRWNFDYRYFCSSEGETLSNLAKDLNEGNNCGKTECEHSDSAKREILEGKEDEGELSEFLLD